MSIEKLKNSNSIICLCGDFNMPDISWEDNCVKTGSNQVALSESLLDIRRAPMWQQSGTLQFCSCHGIAGFLVDELEI